MKFLSLATLVALTGTAAAQPDPQQPPPTGDQPPVAPPVATPDPVRAPDPTPEPKKDEKKEDKKDEPPPTRKLIVGKEGQGLWNPGMLAQGWLQFERSGGSTQISQFRIRRAEISVNGEILPKQVSYRVMVDPARVLDTQTKVTVTDAMGNPVVINNAAKLSVLQDFYITGLCKLAEVSIGQFKIPVSWEGYNSSGKIVFPERAIVSNTFGDKRDLGIRVTKTFEKWMYSGGVYNGSGQDNPDGNAQKDVSLRLEAYPVKGLMIGGVAYDSVGERDRAGTKDRWEGDVRYEQNNVLVQAEVIFARDVAKDRADPAKGRGFYALAGYTIPKVGAWKGDLQPVVRLGGFDPDSATDDNELLHIDAGMNYYLKKHEMKLQLAYQLTEFKAGGKPVNNEVIFAAQVNY